MKICIEINAHFSFYAKLPSLEFDSIFCKFLIYVQVLFQFLLQRVSRMNRHELLIVDLLLKKMIIKNKRKSDMFTLKVWDK